MHSILFSIGPFHVYGYGFMIAVGIICAFTIGCFLAKRSGLDDDALFSMGLVGIVGGIIGAKLLYYIVEFPSIIADPSILLNFGEGFVVYGGLIAGFLSPLIYTRIKKLSFLPYIDCAVPGVAFAQGCGRIGCFLAGCCYGKETSAWYGVIFPADCLAPGRCITYSNTAVFSSRRLYICNNSFYFAENALQKEEKDIRNCYSRIFDALCSGPFSY